MRQKRVNRKRKKTMPKMFVKKKKPAKRRRPKSMKRMDMKITFFK